MEVQKFNPNAFIADDESAPMPDGQEAQDASQSAANAEGSENNQNGEGAEGAEGGSSNDYTLEEAFAEKPAGESGEDAEAVNLTEALAKEGKLPNESISEFIQRKAKEGQENTGPRFNDAGMDDNGYTNEDYAAIDRIQNNLKLPMEELVEKAIRAQYADALSNGSITEDDLADHIDGVKADRMKMVEYDGEVRQSLNQRHRQINEAAKTRLGDYTEQKQTISKTRRESLYNSREIFGEKLNPEVLAQTEKSITSGDFKKAMSDPANEAKMALLWNNLELIEETFKQPGFTDGIKEGKKQYFLRATNSELQDGGNRATTGQRSSKQGFDPKAFTALTDGEA